MSSTKQGRHINHKNKQREEEPVIHYSRVYNLGSDISRCGSSVQGGSCPSPLVDVYHWETLDNFHPYCVFVCLLSMSWSVSKHMNVCLWINFMLLFSETKELDMRILQKIQSIIPMYFFYQLSSCRFTPNVGGHVYVINISKYATHFWCIVLQLLLGMII